MKIVVQGSDEEVLVISGGIEDHIPRRSEILNIPVLNGRFRVVEVETEISGNQVCKMAGVTIYVESIARHSVV